MAGQILDGVVEARAERMSDSLRADFERLVHQRTGMVFGFRRADELEEKVLAAASRAGLESLAAYYDALSSSPTDSRHWDDLVAGLTIGETYFFRNTAHFDALRWEILPPLIRQRRRDRRLRLWSAGCSTGEEPFSLAILLRELIPGIEDWRITILGTDINKASLQRARAGLFRSWSLRKLNDAQRAAYFTQEGDAFALAPRIRDMVTFSYLNLTEPAYPALETNTTAIDLLLCRNVAIYFSFDTIRDIAERLHRCVLDGGWLITGAAETNSEIFSRFASRSFPGAVLYQKSQSALPVPVGRAFEKPGGACKVARGPQAIGRIPPQSSRADERTQVAPHCVAYEQALDLQRQGDEPAAVAMLQRAIALRPEFAEAHYRLCRLHANRGRLAEAKASCVDMLRADPLNAEGHFTWGLIAQEEGRIDEAVEAFRKTLYLSPSFILAHHGLSVMLIHTGDEAQAERHRDAALKCVRALPDDEILPGSESLTAGQLRNMLRGSS